MTSEYPNAHTVQQRDRDTRVERQGCSGTDQPIHSPSPVSLNLLFGSQLSLTHLHSTLVVTCRPALDPMT